MFRPHEAEKICGPTGPYQNGNTKTKTIERGGKSKRGREGVLRKKRERTGPLQETPETRGKKGGDVPRKRLGRKKKLKKRTKRQNRGVEERRDREDAHAGTLHDPFRLIHIQDTHSQTTKGEGGEISTGLNRTGFLWKKKIRIPA